MSQELSRRNFVRNSAVAAAAMAGPAVLPALGQSEKINMGWIGTGGRGYYLLQRAYDGSASAVNVTAVCDTFSTNLNRGKDLVATRQGRAPKAVADYKEILNDKSIDAVVIATPEHLHHRMLLDALAAGKHVYVEKPLSHTIEEAQEILKVSKNSKSIVQVGTQNRSNSLYQMAKTMIEQGIIGNCHYTRAFWYRNALPTGAAAWRYTIPEDLSAQTADWQGSSDRPPSANSTAPLLPVAPLLGLLQRHRHRPDGPPDRRHRLRHGQRHPLVDHRLRRRLPLDRVNDDRDVPDTWSVLLDYEAEKFHVNYSCYLGNAKFGYGEQFCGNEGTIEVINRSHAELLPRGLRPRHEREREGAQGVDHHHPAQRQPGRRGPHPELPERHQGQGTGHRPGAAGFDAVVAGLLSVVSYREGKKILWDSKTDTYKRA
jgi:predicted dehydrogenase